MVTAWSPLLVTAAGGAFSGGAPGLAVDLATSGYETRRQIRPRRQPRLIRAEERSELGLGGFHGGCLGNAVLLIQDGGRGGGAKLVHSNGLALLAHVPLPAEGRAGLDRHLEAKEY